MGAWLLLPCCCCCQLAAMITGAQAPRSHTHAHTSTTITRTTHKQQQPNKHCNSVAARAILVVEKDAVFQRLAGDGLPSRLSIALVTAKGNPDLATRAFLSRLAAAAGPGAPVLGLVDWNPAGAGILAAYKFGTAALGLEGARCAQRGAPAGGGSLGV